MPKPEATINVELAAELEKEIQAAGDDYEHEPGNINFQLKFFENSWPDTKEFVYIARREHFAWAEQPNASSAEKTEFDQRVQIGFLQTGENCRLIDRTIRSVCPPTNGSNISVHIF